MTVCVGGDQRIIVTWSSFRSRQKSLLFRGRIAVENLDIENVEDGTGTLATHSL